MKDFYANQIVFQYVCKQSLFLFNDQLVTGGWGRILVILLHVEKCDHCVVEDNMRNLSWKLLFGMFYTNNYKLLILMTYTFCDRTAYHPSLRQTINATIKPAFWNVNFFAIDICRIYALVYLYDATLSHVNYAICSYLF